MLLLRRRVHAGVLDGVELHLRVVHVEQDLRVQQGVGVDPVDEVQVVPLLEGDLVVVVDPGELTAEGEDILQGNGGREVQTYFRYSEVSRKKCFL